MIAQMVLINIILKCHIMDFESSLNRSLIPQPYLMLKSY